MNEARIRAWLRAFRKACDDICAASGLTKPDWAALVRAEMPEDWEEP